ncbi:uncharacterized protein LOC135984077, partial [Chrysemys picta bellii]|uniref:uncharacterized protein LOC135984077 n=1 Tax=Chrysemys picta bellii TaxID=8478 RepID=UPI0032B272A3
MEAVHSIQMKEFYWGRRLAHIHMEAVWNMKMKVHYLGKNMQNELIPILANAIKKKIVETAQSAKYFSIILNCTPDVSHVKQMAMIIRFVDMEKSADEDNVDVLRKEHFLGFVPLKETTGAFMTETILQELETISLSVENLRNQGYDNGSNMKGNIYDALIEISDTTFTGSSGNTARSDAEALANGLSKFKFVTSLILWYNILFKINLISKQLQEKILNIHSAIQKLQQTKNTLEEFRSDEGFERTLVDSLELAEEIDFPTEFEPESVHIRQKKQQFSYDERDTRIQNPKQRFKVNFYFTVLDTAIHSVDKRFQQMQQLESVFGFLYDIHSLQKKTAKQRREFCI